MLKKLKQIPPAYYLLAAALAAIFVAWALLPVNQWIEALNQWVSQLGVWGMILYALIYAAATVALAPGSVLSIAAGLIFQAWGFPIVLVGATLGATLAFLIARYFARYRVKKMIEQRPKFQAVDRAVAEEGWKIVGLCRLSPLVPFNLQNYLFGATDVTLGQYVVATAIGIIPGAAVYVYIGAIGAASGGKGSVLKWIILGAGLVATIVVTWFVTKRAQAKLAEHGLSESQIDRSGA